jgi:hypothetical protein
LKSNVPKEPQQRFGSSRRLGVPFTDWHHRRSSSTSPTTTTQRLDTKAAVSDYHTLKYLILGCESLLQCVHLSIGFSENFKDFSGNYSIYPRARSIFI